MSSFLVKKIMKVNGKYIIIYLFITFIFLCKTDLGWSTAVQLIQNVFNTTNPKSY